jgi:hypothetical protein
MVELDLPVEQASGTRLYQVSTTSGKRKSIADLERLGSNLAQISPGFVGFV